MSKYIKSFKTKAEYNAYIAGDHATPYTAYVEEENKYYYGAKEPEMLEFEFPASPSGDFELRTVVKRVVIPSGVTTIPSNAYNQYFTALEEVVIPDTVTTISISAFSNNHSLTNINIPDSVITIGQQAFYNTKLTDVYINAENIGQQAFANCQPLTSVTLGDSVRTIGLQSFQYDSNLTSIDFGNGVTEIGQYVFDGCTGIKNITLPSSVTSIGNQAFQGCTFLETMTIKATTPPTIGTNAINTRVLYRIYVPAESVETYKAASGWSDYSGKIAAIPSA